jgi:hypothetical protein
MVNKRSKATSMSVGRDAKTGRFISAKKAQPRPATKVAVPGARRSTQTKKQ